jgi:hypothetical protein
MNWRWNIGLRSLKVIPVDAKLTYRIAQCVRVYLSLGLD